MFAWSTKDRLKPMRMVWLARNHNSPKHELVKWRRQDLRRHLFGLRSLPKIQDDRMRRLNYPRVIDEYGIARRPKKHR